jgi:uracil-DNA glycosylase
LTYADAIAAFSRAGGSWADLPFFRDGSAARLAADLDHKAQAGASILPAPVNILAALTLTPLPALRAVILGQDPYPTPGDAHGLAFSYVGVRRLPGSLKRIFAELADDLGGPQRTNGDLSGWARQGVLLLNTGLSVEAGKAGSHLRLGWSALAEQAVAAVSARPEPCVFILWGDKARAFAGRVAGHHLVIESAHPSPLAARGDFRSSRPFSRANAFLAGNGRTPIDWRL